jgi:hypothetical protein
MSVPVVIDGAAIYRLHWQLGWPLRDTPPPHPHPPVTRYHTSISTRPAHLNQARFSYPITPDPVPYISPNLSTSSSSFSVEKHKNRISEFICFPWPLLSPLVGSKLRDFNLHVGHVLFWSTICDTKAVSTEIHNKTWKMCFLHLSIKLWNFFLVNVWLNVIKFDKRIQSYSILRTQLLFNPLKHSGNYMYQLL